MSKKIFIGSSGNIESLEIANRISDILKAIGVHPTIWNQIEVFTIGDITIETILNASRDFDGGVFIFNKDDPIIINNKQMFTTRDNVILETGIFMGALGKKAVAICKVPGVKEISDLDGLTYLIYDPDNVQNMIGRLQNWLLNIPNGANKQPVLFENRNSVETRLPILQRLNKTTKQIDICCIAGIGLFHQPGLRTNLEKLIENGCKIRIVINTPESYAAFEATDLVIKGGPFEQRDTFIRNALKDLLLWKGEYGDCLSIRTTDFSLPCAIFKIVSEHTEDSSIKVDFYSYNCTEDERRCVYIKYNNREEYEFYERQFEYIYQNAKEVESNI